MGSARRRIGLAPVLFVAGCGRSKKASCPGEAGSTCHTYRGFGERNFGARGLTRVGLRHDRRFFGAFGDNVMPRYPAFSERQLRRLSFFPAASKGVG